MITFCCIGRLDDLNLYAYTYTYNDPANLTNPSGNAGERDCFLMGNCGEVLSGNSDRQYAGSTELIGASEGPQVLADGFTCRRFYMPTVLHADGVPTR